MKGLEPSTFCMAIGWWSRYASGFLLQIAGFSGRGHLVSVLGMPANWRRFVEVRGTNPERAGQRETPPWSPARA
jgi:hypothetical protein